MERTNRASAQAVPTTSGGSGIAGEPLRPNVASTTTVPVSIRKSLVGRLVDGELEVVDDALIDGSEVLECTLGEVVVAPVATFAVVDNLDGDRLAILLQGDPVPAFL